jgi:hypothetical protein
MASYDCAGLDELLAIPLRPITACQVDALLGFVAFVLSFMFSTSFLDLVEMSAYDLVHWLPAPMGAAANAALLFGSLAIRILPKHCNLSCRLAKFGTVMSIALLIPLAQLEGFRTIYPGYGLWVGSMLALWLGARRLCDGNDDHLDSHEKAPRATTE